MLLWQNQTLQCDFTFGADHKQPVSDRGHPHNVSLGI
jgi:hypothetical protein